MSKDAAQVSFDVSCPECNCDVLLPLMKVRAVRSFSGNKIQIEWPSKAEDEYARVACPHCGLVFVVQANGSIAKSDNRLHGKVKKAKNGKRKAAKV